MLPRTGRGDLASSRRRHGRRIEEEGSRGSRGSDQVEEEGRGLKATLGSQNNPAYKLDCWDMETERGEQGGEDGEELHVAIAKRETRINARIPAHVPGRTCTTNTHRA